MNRISPQQQTIATGFLSRRAVLSGLVGTSLAAAFVSAAEPETARAQGTPSPEMPPGYEPNTFILEGPGTHINYGTTSEDGQPILGYRGAYPAKSFHGEEIQVERSAALGPMVSVFLHADPDARVVYLTLLLPEFSQIHLGDPPFTFSTVAILATHLTSIGGPALVRGARQTYDLVPLEGRASFVMS